VSIGASDGADKPAAVNEGGIRFVVHALPDGFR
jgi:hypothetical protein